MKKRYIHTYVGIGEHGYKWDRVEGPFDGVLEALKVLVEKHGPEWVDENIEWLATGNADGNIAWVTDTLGYCITTDAHNEES